jgi:hypothetical protein
MLELAKLFSLIFSILSLYPVLVCAFFVPGSQWEDRLELALLKVAFAACVCLFGGVIFIWPSRSNPDAGVSVTSTLPMRLFFWTTGGTAILFLTVRYLVEGYPTFLWHFK